MENTCVSGEGIEAQLVKILLEAGASITEKAIENSLDSKDLIQLFLENGCDTNLIAKHLLKSIDDKNIIEVFHLINHHSNGEVSWSDVIDDVYANLEEGNNDSDSDSDSDE